MTRPEAAAAAGVHGVPAAAPSTDRPRSAAPVGVSPRFPKGTPEYAAFERELAAELARFVAKESPYDQSPAPTRGAARRAGFGR